MTASIDLASIEEMSKNTLAQTLGMVVTLCEKGRVIITMPVDQRHHQPMGLLHGGVSVALAETAASIGGMVYAAGAGKFAVGQEINANHIYSVRSGHVKAEALPIHIGKTSHVWEVKIHHEESQRLIRISRCTLAIIDAVK